jgi:hypothetical protein
MMFTSNSATHNIYDTISRDIRVFAGGIFEAMFVYVFSNFTLAHTSLIETKGGQLTPDLSGIFSPEYLPTFLFLFALVIFLPLLLSFSLSRREPKKITSALSITIISVIATLFVLVAQSQISLNNLVFILSASTYLPLIGFIEDRVVTFFVGMETNESFIYYEHRLVYSPIEEVKTRLSLKDTKSILYLGDPCESNNEIGYFFKTRRIGYFFFPRYIIEIKISKNSEVPDSTDLKSVYYELGQYGMRDSSRLTQEVYRSSGYLTNLLRRIKPPIDFAVVTDLIRAKELTEPEPLVLSVINEMQGFYSRNRQLSWFDILRFGAIIALLVLSPVLFLSEQTVYGAIVAGFDVLLILASLPDIKNKVSKEKD